MDLLYPLNIHPGFPTRGAQIHKLREGILTSALKLLLSLANFEDNCIIISRHDGLGASVDKERIVLLEVMLLAGFVLDCQCAYGYDVGQQIHTN